MAEGSVTLSREEATVLRSRLREDANDLARGLDEQEQRALLRVVLKLDALDRLGDAGWWLLGDTPQWIQKILRKTFIPPPAPAQTAAPKAAVRRSAAASPAGGKERVSGSGAARAAAAPGAPSGGALDLNALVEAHQAIERSHRSTAEKLEAHEALDAGVGAGGAR